MILAQIHRQRQEDSSGSSPASCAACEASWANSRGGSVMRERRNTLDGNQWAARVAARPDYSHWLATRQEPWFTTSQTCRGIA